jgi:spermidine synthase
MEKIFILDVLIFQAAFLLFQIELIISKIVLPIFGGSYLVWGACVVFFQTMLLLGYLYSHLIIKKLGIFRYRYFHLILLLMPLLFFPGRPLPTINAHPWVPMPIDVFFQLLKSLGLVFFVLSTTSIIFQGWLAVSELPERQNPYILYAASNLGSFVALLSYPFLFEATLDLNAQLLIWRWGYLLFLGLHLIVFRIVGVSQKIIEPKPDSIPINSKERLRWLLLSAAGVIMFLSVTNIITYEIAPIPLLWIIPLCIYLVSFVLVFKKHPWYPDWIKENFHLTVGFSILLYFLIQKIRFPLLFELLGQFFFLFIICMFCQGELHKHKPKDTQGLTIFYLIISCGGFLGGILVSWIIPLISTTMIEYLVGLFLISLALIVEEKKARIGWYASRLLVYIILFLTLWPTVFQRYNIFGLIIIIFTFKFVYSQLKTRPRAFYLSLLIVLCLDFFTEAPWRNIIYIYKHRNFYGIYKVYDKDKKRFLGHGTTLHGAQYLDEKRQKVPLTYYHRLTPVGKLMTSDLFNFSRVGLVGLGAGSLASYAKPSQTFDFFEIDPDIYKIATNYFTYLKNSSGKLNFIFGDARLSLNKILDKRYGLLIIDAFSGDSVPIHLLTKEAIAQYRNCITDNGIILFHTSNRYLDLAGVLFGNARLLNAYACIRSNRESTNRDAFASEWVAFTWDADIFEKLISKLKWSQPDSKRVIKNFRPWTDKYTNLSRLIRLRDLLSEIKNFQIFYW